MTENEKNMPAQVVECEVCLREVPTSEAMSVEAVDYFLYFCGEDCYAEWMGQEKDEPC